jgi:hypothetical protein
MHKPYTSAVITPRPHSDKSGPNLQQGCARTSERARAKSIPDVHARAGEVPVMEKAELSEEDAEVVIDIIGAIEAGVHIS